MKKSFAIFFTSLIIAVSITACRKKSSTTLPTPAKFIGCRISQIVQSDIDTSNKIVYNFSYNDDGTVSKITIPSQHYSDAMERTITYKKNCIIVYTTDNTLPYSKDSMLTDNNNNVTFVDHYEYNGSPQPNLVWDSYQYDSLGNMVLYTYHYYNTTTTSTYEWKNGDLQWNTSGADYVSYLYDTALYNIGNIPSRISDFVSYGRSIYKPSLHLRSKAIADNTDTTTYVYTFDNGGRITYFGQPNTLTPYTWITYTCE